MIVKKSHGYVGLSGDLVIPVALAYDPADPLAVMVTFYRGEDDPSVWTFCRELLAAGLNYDVGEGSLRIGPKPGAIGGLIVFRLVGDGPNGGIVRGVVALPREDVRSFLSMTSQLVPFGSEDDLVAAALDDFLESL